MPTTRPSGIVVPEGTDPPDFDGTIFPDLAESIEDNFAKDTDVTAHTGDNTGVHGIPDTSTLYRAGGVDVPVVDGGTGASNAVNARTNLGLVIGTDVSAPHAHPYEASGAVATHAATPHAGDHPDTDHATLATSASLTAHTGDSGIHGGSVHPDLTVHNALGLATQGELDAHTGDSGIHGGGSGTHPDLATHDALGLTTDTAFAAHADDMGIHGGPGGTHPDLATHDALGLATQAELDTVVTAFSGHGHDLSHSHTDGELPATLARDSEVTSAIATHAGTPHVGVHPDLSTHDALGLATQAELDAVAAAKANTSHSHVDADLPAGIARDTEVTSAISTHAATAHAGDHPDGDHATLVVGGTDGKTLGAVFDKTNQQGNLGATPTFDFATYPIVTGTINATITSMTLTWPTMATDQTYTVLLYLVLGGAFTVTWAAEIKWLDDTAPTLTNAKYHRFYLTRIYNGAWRTEGTFAGKST